MAFVQLYESFPESVGFDLAETPSAIPLGIAIEMFEDAIVAIGNGGRLSLCFSEARWLWIKINATNDIKNITDRKIISGPFNGRRPPSAVDGGSNKGVYGAFSRSGVAVVVVEGLASILCGCVGAKSRTEV